jgi:hypothetical protein
MYFLILLLAFNSSFSLSFDDTYPPEDCDGIKSLWEPREGESIARKRGSGFTKKIKCPKIKSSLIQDKNRPKWFWSRDVDRHGGGSSSGCAWKVFSLVENNKMKFLSCADVEGTFITGKHESLAGKVFECK